MREAALVSDDTMRKGLKTYTTESATKQSKADEVREADVKLAAFVVLPNKKSGP
jgi:hypothetical protein